MTAEAPAITSLFQAEEEKGRVRDKGVLPEFPTIDFCLCLMDHLDAFVWIDSLPSTTVRVSVLQDLQRVVSRQPTVSAA